jgi:hypothetical protein
MAETTITGLPNATTPLDGTERVPMDQNGATVDASTQAIAALADGAISSAVAAHVAAADPHPGYLTAAEGDAAYVGLSDARLSDAREWTAATIEQAEAETGTATTRRAFTAQRVRQSIAAWWTSASTAAGRAMVEALDAAAQRTLLGLGEEGSPFFTGLTITGTAPVVIPHIHGSIAGNFYVHVKNTSGGPLAAGTAVYATGSVGNTDRITVAACDPTDPLKMPAIGVLEATLAQNGDGDAVILGELRPFNSNSYQLGDQLYVGAGGAMVATIPASGEVQQVGSVVRVNVNTGTILVNTGAAMARVGFTGAYGDLSGLPTIPSTYADLGPIGDGIIFTISNRGETATPGTNYDESLPLSFAVTITKVTFITHIDNTGSSTTTLSAYKRTAAGTKTSLLSANATLASGASVVVASLSATAGVLSLAAGDRLGVDLVGLGTGASGIKCIIEYTRSAV